MVPAPKRSQYTEMASGNASPFERSPIAVGPSSNEARDISATYVNQKRDAMKHRMLLAAAIARQASPRRIDSCVDRLIAPNSSAGAGGFSNQIG
jgi:hypothetical protein